MMVMTVAVMAMVLVMMAVMLMTMMTAMVLGCKCSLFYKERASP